MCRPYFVFYMSMLRLHLLLYFYVLSLHISLFLSLPCSVSAHDYSTATTENEQDKIRPLVDENEMVDKRENPWTISALFKQHIVDFLHGPELAATARRLGTTSSSVSTTGGRRAGTPPATGEQEVVSHCDIGIELGAHLGLTTSVLAPFCHQYWALENSIAVLRKNMDRNKKLKNVLYFEFHSVLDDWDARLPKNEEVSFLFIDAAHDLASVLHDLKQGSRRAEWLILDDYGAERGVREAVRIFTQELGRAVVHRFVGEVPPWTFDDERVIDFPEGVILKVRNFVSPAMKRCLVETRITDCE